MATVYLRGKTWWVKYRASDGSRVQKSLKTKDKKIAKAVKLKIEYEASTGHQIIGSIPTFGEYAEGYLAWRELEYPDSQERVAQIVEQHLKPEFEFMTLNNIRKKETEEWITKRRKAGAKTGTVEKELRPLKAIINHAVEYELVPQNRMRYVRIPKSKDDKVPGHYAKVELEALYKASPNHADIWRFMVNTGLRRGEVRNLKLENVHEEHIIVVSETNARTKSGKMRTIPLNDAAKTAVKALKEHGNGIYLCPRMHPKSYSRAFATCAERAKLPGSIHWLRHTFATHALLAKVPTRVLQELLGHSTIRLTEKYAQVLPPSALTSAVKSFNL